MRRSIEANKALEKKLNIACIVISIVALAAVIVSGNESLKWHTNIDFSFLPAFHSSVNAVTALILIMALYFIKNGNVSMHRKSIYAAMVLSFIFLCSYLLYRFTNDETSFCKEGFIRYIYFFLLISHIILAGLILPFIFFTFIRAYTEQFDRHKKMARWVFPLWLYVAITGPVIYLMLKDCY